MRGLWLENGNVRYRDDLNAPRPDGEVLIRVLRAGICNTDLEMMGGYYPFAGVPGHEFVGVVEQGAANLMGRRVVGEINATCGECSNCLEGRRSHCERRTVLGIRARNGSFADYVTLPRENLHLVPDGVTTDAATFTEPLAAALEIQEQIHVGPDQRVLVLGAGKLGQLVAQTLSHTGCDLMAVGRTASTLSLLAVRDIQTGAPGDIERGGFDIAVDCTGSPDGFTTAANALRPRGTLVMKSTYAGDLTFNASAIVVNELTLIGSRCGPFALALEMLEDQRVDVMPLVEERFSLERGLEALTEAAKPGVLKVLLEMD